MARFLHIADLHLGRTLHHVRLLQDQRIALQGIETLLRTLQPKVDALLIAGDVFDRSVPPTEAVTLLNEFVQTVAGELGIQVVMIPGNHDSAARMGFMSALTKDILHIAPPVHPEPQPVRMQDEHGEVEIYALPFLDPPLVRSVLNEPEVKDHQTAMDAMLQTIRARDSSARKVLVAHAFVNDASGSAKESESERNLYVGGSSVVRASSFHDFEYVALGHLHQPQKLGSERIQYSGSLLKYSKSESAHKKSVTLIDLGAPGTLATQRLPLSLRHDLRVKRGLFEDLMVEPDDNPEDYLYFELQNKDPISDVMSKLRDRFPNTVHLTYLNREREDTIQAAQVSHQQRSIEEHFTAFYEVIHNEKMSAEKERRLEETVQALGEALQEIG